MRNCRQTGAMASVTCRLYFFCVIALTMSTAGQVKTRGSDQCPQNCTCSNWTVNCSNAELTGLQRFHYPNDTVRLILDNNHIKGLPSNAFGFSTKVQSLSIKNNHIMKISSDAFVGLENLETLSLDDNEIQSLPENVFQKCSKLRTLSMENNQIVSFDLIHSSFRHLSSLVNLNLRNNYLKCNILPNGFRYLRNLTNLELGTNELNAHPGSGFFNVLSDLPLEYLGLSSTGFIDIKNDTFDGLRHVDNIDLSENVFDPIDLKNIFHGLRKSTMREIHLRRIFANNCKLNRDVFKPLNESNLRILDLSENDLAFVSGVPRGLFEYATSLEELDLRLCEISKFETEAFRGLTNLKRLHLQQNSLNCIESLSSCLFLSMGPELTNLEYLDLSDNMLHVGRYLRFAQEQFPSLSELYLQKNKLEVIIPSMFFNLTNLEVLDLSWNGIQSIAPYSFQMLPALDILTIEGNPGLTRLRNCTFSGLHDLDELYLGNNHILIIEANAFDGLDGLEYLYMNHNNIRSLPNVDTKMYDLVLLDLQRNKLENIPEHFLNNLDRLEQLLLSENHLSNWTRKPWDCYLLSSLKLLDVSYNDIVRVKSEAFVIFEALRKVNLAGNPFVCTCDISDFSNWLATTQIEFPGQQDLTCKAPVEYYGYPLANYKPSTWECKAKDIVIPVLTCVGTIIVVVCLVMLLQRWKGFKTFIARLPLVLELFEVGGNVEAENLLRQDSMRGMQTEA